MLSVRHRNRIQIIITLSGRGKVGEGAKQALNQLKVKWVKDHELKKLSTDPGE